MNRVFSTVFRKGFKMSPDTGEIREFQTLEEARKVGFTIPVKRRKPKDNCHRCYGRGYIGTNDEGCKVPCRCVL